MLDRREFLIGTAAVALVAAMPIAAADDPLVLGIRWQSWPWKGVRPKFYAVGSLGPNKENRRRPLSYFVDYVESLRPLHPNIVWKTDGFP